ncbi:MAG: RNA polymerase sigma factor [Desulfobacterales bacterium]|nr:MAG: RNA polymerase sigma factor [Desulfobacterales bacterium]
MDSVKKFRAFYIEHKDKFFAYLMRMTGDYHLAGDIMQESFTRYLERYGADNQSAALLYTIGRNVFFDNRRRQKRNTPLQEDQPDCAQDQEYDLWVREEYRQVLTALQKLDEGERDLLALVVSSGLAYREIAKMVGISEANLKVKVHRSRTRLRQILQAGDL